MTYLFYFYNVFEFLKRWIHAFVAKLSDRFFCWFWATMLVPISIQISINLGKKFLCISCIRNIAMTWILVTVFAYLPSFFSQIVDLIHTTVLIFILISFEWCDTENQPFLLLWTKGLQQLGMWLATYNDIQMWLLMSLLII